MIPSSPRLVAFAQSECDLTTPSVSRLHPMSFYLYIYYSTETIYGNTASSLSRGASKFA
jgi:hypothetical protein